MSALWRLLSGLLLAAAIVAPVAHAGSEEERVIASCAPKAGNGYAYAACVAAGLSANEMQTCINTPQRCFGPGNEFRKYLCAVGIGCAQEEYVNELERLIPYNGGCIAVFKSGIYFSPDCTNLRGQGRTENVWKVDEPHASYVRDLVVFDDCVYTAFSGGGIYRSCDGRNLGGGGNTTKVYEGQVVRSMTATPNGLVTVFQDGSCYLSPDGLEPGGGKRAGHCR